MTLTAFFEARSIAVIGASKDPSKIGHIILKGLIDAGFAGPIYPINLHEPEILTLKAYPSVRAVKEKIELAVLSVPAAAVLDVVEDCGRKGITSLIIISSGFGEIGDKALETRLLQRLRKYRIRAIGPNCLGTLNPRSKLDTVFLPPERLPRPQPGSISFLCQSGAVASTLLDLMAYQGYGIAKFASYGNAVDVDESDLLEYLGKDKDTKVICIYIEGLKDGKKFLRIAQNVAKRKVIIALKGGLSDAGSQATLSHTGSLAGSGEVYLGAFRQTGIIHASTLEEMLSYAKIFEKSQKPKGNRVQIITDGGGYGILTTDAVIREGLRMAQMEKKTRTLLQKKFPPITIIKNPIDLAGDADTFRYRTAIEACLNDKNIDIILVILLYQPPKVTEDVIEAVIQLHNTKKKPIIVTSTGGAVTEKFIRMLQDAGVPCFPFPEQAVKAIKQLTFRYTKQTFK